MMKTYCNPLDLGYRYQHMKEGERIAGFREGADPTLVYFKGKYYLFVSMSAGFMTTRPMCARSAIISIFLPAARGVTARFCARLTR